MSKQVKGKIKSMFAKNKASSGTAFDKGTNRGVISKEILKVSIIHSFIHLFFYSFIHSFI